MKMTPETVELLRRSTLSGDGLSLTIPQTDYKVYKALAKVLEIYEGKWNRKAQAVLFPRSFAAKMAELTETGEVNDKKNPLDYFHTPAHVVRDMLDYTSWIPAADVRILEPSAGTGHIADYLLEMYDVRPDCVELDKYRAQTLRDKGYTVYAEDFLTFEPPQEYDLILMNPPFRSENDANVYITHVMYAHSLLGEGGCLVAIVPEGFMFRQDAKIAEFREFVKQHGAIGESLPADTFKESGTGVVTRIISLVAS